MKTSRLCSLHQNPDCTKVLKNDFDDDLIQSSNLTFCVATGLVFPINVSVEVATAVEEDSIEKFLLLILALKVWYSGNALEFSFWITSIRYCKTCFAVSRGLIFSVKVSIRSFNFLQTIGLKKCRSSSLQMKPDGPKIPKSAVTFDLSRCSNSISPTLQVWIVVSRSQSISLELWQISRRKSSRMCFLHQNSDCTKVSKTDFHGDLIFKLYILRSYRFGFSHQRVNRKLYNYSGEFDWRFFYFDSCITILMSGNAQMVFSFESRRSSEKCFSVSRGLIFSIKVSIEKKIIFVLTFRLERCHFSSLQQKPDGPKVPKVSMNFGLSRYSDSIFSDLSGSICCIKISIEFSWSCHKSNDYKNNRFSFLHQNPDCTKVAKTDLNTDLTCYSNMIFCVATDLASANKMSIKNLTIAEEDSIETFLWFLH